MRFAVVIVIVRVRLTRKFAPEIDGVDLSRNDVGEIVDLPVAKAQLLIAEGWAVAERRGGTGPLRVVAFRRDSDPGHSHDEGF
jgi:hypothetical protein